MNIAFTDSNNEVLKKYAEVWSGIKDQIKKINDSRSGEYDKDYMKIKFNAHDNLPLTIVIKNVFEKYGKYCIFLSCHVHVSERIHTL